MNCENSKQQSASESTIIKSQKPAFDQELREDYKTHEKLHLQLEDYAEKMDSQMDCTCEETNPDDFEKYTWEIVPDDGASPYRICLICGGCCDGSDLK